MNFNERLLQSLNEWALIKVYSYKAWYRTSPRHIEFERERNKISLRGWVWRQEIWCWFVENKFHIKISFFSVLRINRKLLSWKNNRMRRLWMCKRSFSQNYSRKSCNQNLWKVMSNRALVTTLHSQWSWNSLMTLSSSNLEIQRDFRW